LISPRDGCIYTTSISFLDGINFETSEQLLKNQESTVGICLGEKSRMEEQQQQKD